MRSPSRRALLIGAAAAALATAAGVAAAEPGDEPKSTADSPLPFDLPSQAVLKGSNRKVFAHYFTSFPISLDNQDSATDYYTRNYLNPAGEKGIHSAYGGLLRDRPLPRAPLSGDWEAADMVTEITRATQAGIDGFTTDLLSIDTTSRHWWLVKALLAAAPTVDPAFKIVLMPDMNAGTIKNTDAAGLASALSQLITGATYRLPDGRLLVAPFKAENRSPDWWAQFIAAMKTDHGETVALVPMVLNVNDVIHGGKNNIDAYAPISYGIAETENGAPKNQDSIPGKVVKAHAAGLVYMASLTAQDSRPNQGNYYEACNSENLRAGWEKSIAGGADWVQLMTWNDYSESTHVSPSVHNGWVWLDVSSYYLTRFKTGQYPAIVRDTVYLSHRRQLYAAMPTSGDQTKFQVLRATSGPARDTAEALTFLSPGTAATGTITVAGRADTYTAEAGVQAKTVPLNHGEVSVSVKRGGAVVAAVTSPWLVNAQFASQDLQYCAAGSRRP